VVVNEPRNGLGHNRSAGLGSIKCNEKDLPKLSIESEFLDIWRKVEEFLFDENNNKMTISYLSGPRHLEAYVQVANELKVGYNIAKEGKEFILFKFKTDEEKESFVGPKPRSGMLNNPSVVSFQSQDVVKKNDNGDTDDNKDDDVNIVQKDDIVTFNLVMDRRSLKRFAKDVKLKERAALKLAPAADGTERSLKFTNPRKMRSSDNLKSLNSVTYREAAGPDKTLGFTPGWRDRMRNGEVLSSENSDKEEQVDAVVDGEVEVEGKASESSTPSEEVLLPSQPSVADDVADEGFPN
jgi:hypothetical protein